MKHLNDTEFRECVMKIRDYALARMRMGEIPKDDALFWRTVDIHRQIFHCDDDKEAAKTINKMLTEATKGIV